jgi:hypothetical protein
MRKLENIMRPTDVKQINNLANIKGYEFRCKFYSIYTINHARYEIPVNCLKEKRRMVSKVSGINADDIRKDLEGIPDANSHHLNG